MHIKNRNHKTTIIREELIEKLLVTDCFAKTPLQLARFMASLRNANDKRFADLMAGRLNVSTFKSYYKKKKQKQKQKQKNKKKGNGNITMYIPNIDFLLAAEKNKKRCNAGRMYASHAKWIHTDIFDTTFIIDWILKVLSLIFLILF